MSWKSVLELSSRRQRTAGSEEELLRAVANAADLRIGTEFRHNEHIDIRSTDSDLIREFMTFDVTYLVENRWAAGICTRRQPVLLPGGLGPKPSLSLFMYNQNGQQAVASLGLDGPPPAGRRGADKVFAHEMSRYHQQDAWDNATNAPSQNFIYDFDTYRFLVEDRWRPVLHNAADGTILAGSVGELAEHVNQGANVKVGISRLCDDLAADKSALVQHEVFVGTVATYHYTGRKLFIAATQPLVRVRPAIPMAYASESWDMGWLVVRSDGRVASMLYDPYTLCPHQKPLRCGVRWFVDQ